MVELNIEAAWAAGLLLALTRIGAFVVASPIYARAFPMTGRIAFTLVLGFFFAEPVTETIDLWFLVRAGAVNAAAGVALGFLTGLIFHLFAVAGSLIDFSSSLSTASIVDPVSGSRSAVFSRGFNLLAITLFLLVGGDHLVVAGLAATFEAVPAAGALTLTSGLADLAVSLLGQMILAAVELAIPALAALFVAEVVLGVASRFAPQANIFLIGLPVKVIAALATGVPRGAAGPRDDHRCAPRDGAHVPRGDRRLRRLTATFSTRPPHSSYERKPLPGLRHLRYRPHAWLSSQRVARGGRK